VIVLDENIAQASIIEATKRWYKGRVCVIRELRPQTVIKDEAIPTLLVGQRQPTFVTTNAIDFWQKVTANPRYCIVCLVLPSERQQGIPDVLRRLFHTLPFKTKRPRMGKVVRASGAGVQFYQIGDEAVHALSWKP
jgi:hypothetical protein